MWFSMAWWWMGPVCLLHSGSMKNYLWKFVRIVQLSCAVAWHHCRKQRYVYVITSPMKICRFRSILGTPLVAQWLRIRLPVQGTRVRALVWEDPTCRGATKPVCHNYWACALEPASHNCWAHAPQLMKPVCLEPVLRNKRSHRNEKPAHHEEE